VCHTSRSEVLSLKPHADHRRTRSQHGGSAIGLCLLLMVVSFLPAINLPASLPSFKPANSTYFPPSPNATGVNLTSTGMLSVPANQTFLDGVLEVTPIWADSSLTGHRFGVDFTAGWNGNHNGTQGIGHGGQLSLATQSTLATLTDFETLIETVPGWEGHGANHSVWNVQPMTGVAQSAGQPANATHGQRVLATLALGGLEANMEGCLASPIVPVPAFISRFNMTFDHWLSFLDDDAAWVEWRVNGGSWQTATPVSPYPNASNLAGVPSAVWSGQSASWERAAFMFDAFLPASASQIEVRFCFQTSASEGSRNGWFIDNLNVSNQGDEPGAWFHGNMSGDYAHNADGRLYLHADLAGYSGPLELEFWANWDLEGAFADNMMVALSVNNGSTWQSVSGIPGLPGNGLSYQGNFYMDESLTWIPISYALPSNLASHPNASAVLFEFQVQTNHQTGFGGFASSGWEGIAIDDIVVHHRRGTVQAEEIPLANFTNASTDTFGDKSGWLDHSSSINEWMWTTDFGMNGPESTVNSFETSMTAPPGWVIEGTWPDGWEVGSTRNTSGYGPGVFHSGNNGAAINLTTRYTNNVYTHLVTQEYSVPVNASARLSFRSWVCTEANWDGGGVSISNDGGQTWWWLPTELNGFHDQISTVNTNSPFFGRGIIDGSTLPNGCGANKNRPFELKTYDLSNLSGQTLKARFSFFSDTFVEADGWYIDDAGIEIDVFETEGHWTSPAMVPDPLFGYGWLDGWYEQPDGTTLLFDVLDAQLNPIFGHENLTLPAQLALDPVEHPTVHLRVSMTTNDTYVTPLVHSLVMGRTVFIGPEHVRATSSGANATTVNGDGDLVVNTPFTLILPELVVCPFDGYRLTNFGDNLTFQLLNQQLVSSAYVAQPSKTTFRNYTLGGELAVVADMTLSAVGGEVFERAKVEFDCVRPTVGPHVNLGWNNATVFDWPPEGMAPTFGLNTQWSETVAAGVTSVWEVDSPSASFELNNASLALYYRSLERTSSLGTGLGVSMNLMVSNASANATVEINGVQQPLNGETTVLSYTASNGCPGAVVNASFSTTLSLVNCRVLIEVNGSADLKVLNMLHLAPNKIHQVELTSSLLNAAKEASATGNGRAVLTVPVHIQTESGGLRLGLNTSTLPLMVEVVDPPVHTRWLPETSVSFTTHHLRENPLNTGEDAPDIDVVDFYLAYGPSLDAAFVHVQLDRVQDSPRFRQLAGAGLAQFNGEQSEVSCSLNMCSITWNLTSTWLLDDVDDLYVLTQATDEAGLQVGPTVFVRRTPFNEVENDLEVVEFTVRDATMRRLDDWTHSFWPYHLSEDATMLAQGRVRLEGVADQWVKAGEAEASVTLRAVPPKNTSGGPDEWVGEPVLWSQTWSGEVGQDGWFTLSLASPNADSSVPSNTWLEIKPSLSRRGPTNVNATTSQDRTVVLTPTRILHDTVSPRVESLTVLDSGREVLADGYVGMQGRTLPLRLQLSDPEGLDSLLEVWTWLEHQDDDNANGLMEPEEYTKQTVSLNRGVKFIEVDLPLISSSQVLGGTAFEGRVSVVVKGQDLAGNPLLGGGNFGAADDLATMLVQQRADTTVDEVQLDRLNGSLLAGHEHRFSFTLADANGLSSLDEIRLALLGEDHASSCFIHYEPRFAELMYDAGCFLEEPTVQVQQRSFSSVYDVTVRFRLDWNASQNVAREGGTPSLKIIDEGQDLGLGLHQLPMQRWVPNVALDLRWINITDTTAPYGEHNQTTYWFHRSEVISHQLGVFHAGTEVLARDVPQEGHLTWELNDGERRETGVFLLESNGSMMLNITMNGNVMYHDYGNVSVTPTGYESYALNGLSYLVVLDDRSPKLVLPPGTLESLSSNALSDVPLTLSINDDTHMPPIPLRMHSVFYRMGQPVEGTQRIDYLNISDVMNAYTVYAGSVNFQPEGVALTRSDILVVWFEATDRSGRSLTGLGTVTAPLNIGLTWVAFEPVFTDLSATPYRPEVGDNIVVYARIANNGLLPGNLTVLLRDDEGQVLESTSLSLDTGSWVNVVWNVEAWKVGRLGLTVQIENHTPIVPVPLADIQPNDKANPTSGMAALSLSVLAVVIAGIVLFIVRQQRAERDEAYHLERIRRIVQQRLPPPIPFDLAETTQEE
jgi:hypothetical protein